MRSRLLLMAGGLAVVALALAPASPAATCPPGETGTPPYCAPPSPPPRCPRFSIVKVKTGANGTARITVNVEQPGRITISGKAIRTARIKARRSGRFTITVRVKGKLRSLERTGGTALTPIRITYRSGGCRTKLKRVVRV